MMTNYKDNVVNADTGFVSDCDILFLAKFGKKEHLQNIVDGYMRFSPSQKYVEQEQLLHDKGQGDMLEGKMKIHATSAQFTDQSGQVYVSNQPRDFYISIQDVNNMPIVCFSIGKRDDCSEYYDEHNYRIRFTDDGITTIKSDFHNPDSVLLIFEPQRFISDMINALNVAASSIRYYDYSINTLQQYRFLCSGDENGANGGSMLYENRYRHLLCKDNSFDKQKEYRFIKLDELIELPKSYNFTFDYKYALITCDELFSGALVDI